VIWDCRGDSVGELKETIMSKSFFFKILGFIYFLPQNKFQLWFIQKFCDAAIFVSKALYKHFSSSYISPTYSIIPCPVNEKLFFFKQDLRIEKRRELNISEHNNVFLYSGSLAIYQSIELQIPLYQKILSNEKNIIFFATSDLENAKQLFSNFSKDRFRIINVPFLEMNTYLNISDYAILIRDNKFYNNVASPTKFGEYCLSGLSVIMNDTVDQAVEFSKKIGNYWNWDDLNFVKLTDVERKNISQKSINIFSRDALNEKYFNFYKQVFDL
jgi:hypothetical protein